MRIDGFSSQSYPISRKPRKGQATVDESVIDERELALLIVDRWQKKILLGLWVDAA